MMWGGKLLSGIKSMYADGLACIRVKGGESETGVYHVPLAFQCIYGCSDEGGEDLDREEGSEISGRGESVNFTGLLNADDLVLFGESEEELRAMVGWFAEVCRRRGQKVNAGKSKMMVLMERRDFSVRFM